MNRRLVAGLVGVALALGSGSPLLARTPAMQAQPALPWKTYTQQVIDRWLAIDPATAVYQGAHQYDGKLPDWSEAGLKARGDFLRSVIAGAHAYSRLTGAVSPVSHSA